MHMIDLTDCKTSEEMRDKVLSDSAMDMCLDNIVEQIINNVKELKMKHLEQFYVTAVFKKEPAATQNVVGRNKSISLLRMRFNVYNLSLPIGDGQSNLDPQHNFFMKAVEDGVNSDENPFAFFYVSEGLYSDTPFDPADIMNKEGIKEVILVCGITNNGLKLGAIIEFNRGFQGRIVNPRLHERIDSVFFRREGDSVFHSNTLVQVASGFLAGRHIAEKERSRNDEQNQEDDDGEGRDDLGAWTEGDLL